MRSARLDLWKLLTQTGSRSWGGLWLPPSRKQFDELNSRVVGTAGGREPGVGDSGCSQAVLALGPLNCSGCPRGGRLLPAVGTSTAAEAAVAAPRGFYSKGGDCRPAVGASLRPCCVTKGVRSPRLSGAARKGPRSEHGGRGGGVPCPEPPRGPRAGGTRSARAGTGLSRAGQRQHRPGAAPLCGERGRERWGRCRGAGPGRHARALRAAPAAAAGPPLPPRRGVGGQRRAGPSGRVPVRRRAPSRSRSPPARLAADAARAAREDGGSGRASGRSEQSGRAALRLRRGDRLPPERRAGPRRDRLSPAAAARGRAQTMRPRGALRPRPPVTRPRRSQWEAAERLFKKRSAGSGGRQLCGSLRACKHSAAGPAPLTAPRGPTAAGPHRPPPPPAESGSARGALR